MYLFLSSNDAKSYYSTNTATDFTVQLPETLVLKGEWWCSLEEIKFLNKFAVPVPSLVYVCCDFVEDSYVGGRKLPVLRTVSIKPRSLKTDLTFDNPFYLRVSRSELRQLRVYIKTPTFRIPSLPKSTLECMLRLHHGKLEETLREHGSR